MDDNRQKVHGDRNERLGRPWAQSGRASALSI